MLLSYIMATSGIILYAILAAASGCYLFPSDVPNPCIGVSCGNGALCRPTADGRSYSCDCPTSCPSYGDHDASRPLCATDATDYPNECEMRRAACETNTNITFKYYGKCDPCAGVTCPDPEICQLNESREPVCRCAESCPLEFSPVCASDGKTYSNECQMNRESCRARKHLRLVFKGQCSTGVNPCAEVECRHGAECRVEGVGAVCACPVRCESVLRPVCGADGRTYDTHCHLTRTSCLLGRDIRLHHNGACGSSGVCAGRVCPHGGECISSSGRATCRCPRCSTEFAPVCGSDGISYGNRCKLQLEACTHRRDVTVLYDGPCNGCEYKKCDYYAVCESDGVSEANCVCPKHCEEGTETEEVCGNDNKTYSSVCALRNTSCKEQRRIHVKHTGSCDSCATIKCPPLQTCNRGICGCDMWCGESVSPICGSDGTTYTNMCHLTRTNCQKEGRDVVEVKHQGECLYGQDPKKLDKAPISSNEINSPDDTIGNTSETSTAVCARVQCSYEATCAVDGHGQPRCACLFDCAAASSSSSAPVCASDLRLYPTLCHMKLEACRRQEDLRLRPLALCQGIEFRPCGEDEPIMDVDGRPMDCGGGPHRKDCPAGSYCHHTTKAARCCRKVKTTEAKQPSNCLSSVHGCCPDGVTSADSNGIGCRCSSCHRVGALGCDLGGACVCRPGVGGDTCDRCHPGYWGLTRVDTGDSGHTADTGLTTVGSGHHGCIPCGCSAFGSVREDCEQMTGRCVCKPGIQGQKCTVCSNHEHILGANGCYDPESTQLPATSCDHMTCYFGAYCVIRSGLATCECATTECSEEDPTVCGSDERTYLSACHLRTHACRTQSDIVVQAFGPCSEETPQVRRVNISRNEINNIDSDEYIDECTFTNEVDTAYDDYSTFDDYLAAKTTENAMFRVPLFDSQSSITFKTILPGSKLDIFAELTAVCGDGALLSALGIKDFLWLGFVDDEAVLRWDAGSGALDLRVGKLRLDGKTTLSVKKYKKDGVLSLDNLTAMGSSKGSMSSVDVEPYVYVGHPPENFTGLPGVKTAGFVGCIHRLRVSGHNMIPPAPGLPLTAQGLKPCTPHNLARLVCP